MGSDGLIKEKTKEQWWEKYREIQRNPEKLHTIEHLRKALKTYFRDDWNAKTLRGHGKSRRDVWLEGLSSSLPAPELEQYVAFGAASAWKPLTPSSSGIYHKETYYQPTSEGGYNRLKNAVSKGIKVPFYILPFSEGDLARASFDEGHTWETVVPAEKYSISTREHVDLQEAELRDTKQELQEGLDQLFSLLNERYSWDKPGFIMGSRVIVPGEIIKEQKASQKVETQSETKPNKTPGRKRGSQKNQPPVQEQATATSQSSTDDPEVNTDPKLSEDKARAFLERYNQRRARQAQTDTDGEAG